MRKTRDEKDGKTQDTPIREADCMTDEEVAETLRLLRESAESIPQELQQTEELKEHMGELLAQQDEESKDAAKGAGKKKNKVANSLKSQLLRIYIIPICIMLALLLMTASFALEFQIRRQVKKELSDAAVMLEEMIGQMYEGEYVWVTVDKSNYAFCKGEHVLNEQDSLILDAMRAKTDTEYSIFYQDARVLTTMKDADGQRNVATSVGDRVYKAVVEKGQERFYDNAAIGRKRYYAYYAPLSNPDGEIVGMVGTARELSSLSTMRFWAILPIAIAAGLTVAVVVLIIIRFTDRLTGLLKKMEKFMAKVSQGNLSAELSPDILSRHDEFSGMGRSILSMQRSIRELVERDALTTMYNRQYGEKQLQTYRKRALENGEEYVVAIGDLDHFKNINDTYGHECGDRVLKGVAAILKKYMGTVGFSARWGGEEFLMVQKDTDMETARKRFEKLLEEIREMKVESAQGEISVTMSIGMTKGEPNDELNVNLQRADKNLYEAKKSGRNRVVAK